VAEKKRASASVVKPALRLLMKEWGWLPSDIITMLRGGGTSAKGSDYEREMCGRLSRWWTAGARDDVFWRSSGSGARAKVRGRATRETAGQHGDIAATMPIGEPLIDIMTIEIKRGYSEYTVQDILDHPATAAQQEWEKWFEQVLESHEAAGSFGWFLITRRDRREAMCWMPDHLLKSLRQAGAFAKRPTPLVSMWVVLRNSDGTSRPYHVTAMLLDDFLAGVTPAQVLLVSQVC
jgi:hypothetical protein